MDTRYCLNDLREGTVIEFQVLAENAAGIGPPSEPTDLVVIQNPTYPPGLYHYLLFCMTICNTVHMKKV